MTYQQPTYPPAPGHPFNAPPPARKRRWPWIVAGILVLGTLGCVGLFTLVLGGTAAVVGEAVTEADDNQKGKNAVAGVLGKPATDGKFEFTVHDMKCGVKQVGGEFGVKAQGEFCLINVTVKNVADTPESFDSSSQKVYDAAGAEYSADGSAETYVNDEGQTFLESINPGNKIKGTLVFDVPKGSKLTSIVVHESMFTPGIRVPLA